MPEDCQLVAQGLDLEGEVCARAKEGGDGVEKRSQHAAIMARYWASENGLSLLV